MAAHLSTQLSTAHLLRENLELFQFGCHECHICMFHASARVSSSYFWVYNPKGSQFAKWNIRHTTMVCVLFYILLVQSVQWVTHISFLFFHTALCYAVFFPGAIVELISSSRKQRTFCSSSAFNAFFPFFLFSVVFNSRWIWNWLFSVVYNSRWIWNWLFSVGRGMELGRWLRLAAHCTLQTAVHYINPRFTYLLTYSLQTASLSKDTHCSVRPTWCCVEGDSYRLLRAL